MIGTQSGSAAVAQSQSSVEGSTDSLFADDGSLIPADEVKEEADVSGESLTEVLKKLLPTGKVAQIESNKDDLPGDELELLMYHAEKEGIDVDEVETSGEGDGTVLEITHEQAEMRSFEKRVQLDEAEEQQYEYFVEVCPNCGAGEDNDEEYGVMEQILQTRAADESGTIIRHIDCPEGCTCRRND